MKKNQGYIALLTILITSAIAIVTALTLLSSGIGNLQTSISNNDYVISKINAKSCSEIILNRIRNDISYVNNGSEQINDGVCNYSIIEIDEENRELQIESKMDNNTYREIITIFVTPSYIEITEKFRVSNF